MDWVPVPLSCCGWWHVPAETRWSSSFMIMLYQIQCICWWIKTHGMDNFKINWCLYNADGVYSLWDRNLILYTIQTSVSFPTTKHIMGHVTVQYGRWLLVFHDIEIWRRNVVLSTYQKMIPARNAVDTHAQDSVAMPSCCYPSPMHLHSALADCTLLAVLDMYK